eukprot:CAMPEP_0114523612 /NCGR_PEP_ID=MMETSP0109-20121206/21387_1 /TAXON_ID=29199 /ORGANISM="Chlorarachnion reptans, Strain CCCM449" /LENGTH=148 /DNA_ID=CAMNT_0001704945 /DNA_START=107 /DNA_END=550 /DNA_ORIENTATION=-
MPQGGLHLTLPVRSYSFLRQDIQIPVIYHVPPTLPNRLGPLEPLVMKWNRRPESHGDDFAALRIPMKPDPTIINVEVVVAFTRETLRFRPDEHVQAAAEPRRERNCRVRDNPALLIGVVRLLGLIVVAQVVPRVLVHNPPSHPGLPVP